MLHDDTLGVYSLDLMIIEWSKTHEIDYKIEKITVKRGGEFRPNSTLMGYRLLDRDAILFKMEFNLAKFQDLTDVEYKVYDTL